MGTYSLDFNKAKNRLFIITEGIFSDEDAIKYVDDLKKYIADKKIKTILVDSRKMKPLSTENTARMGVIMNFPQIAATWQGSAVIVDSAVFKAVIGQAVKSMNVEKQKISYFNTIEEGEAFLDKI